MTTSKTLSLEVRGPMTPIDQLVLPGFSIHRPCIRCARAMSRINPKKLDFDEKFQKSVCCRRSTFGEDAPCDRCHKSKTEVFLPRILIPSYTNMFRIGRAVHYDLAHSNIEIIPRRDDLVQDFKIAAEEFKEQFASFCEGFGDNPLALKKAEIIEAGLATGFAIPDEHLAPFTAYGPHDEIGAAASVPTDYYHVPDQPLPMAALLARIIELELADHRRETTLKQYEHRLRIVEKRLGIESQEDAEEDDPTLANIDPQLFNWKGEPEGDGL
ncbi:hypothetical protein QBC44DRAFT_384566 [Cladorrhinum sp. PSN332]|nr:hypothetical protein QBC44DRAFT_384566 [Cladorrhinum sp. PSN332]